ncbi:glutamate-rich protein 6B, partial [Erinaceus europaeus]|uniref:Glutamate-rich protein 6B n=1 Tax=Erinaceus europaeus TaxID=9365 RepID=A0ABM3WV07_ERIEU
MSAENGQDPPHPPAASQHPAESFASEEEKAEVQLPRKSKQEPPLTPEAIYQPSRPPEEEWEEEDHLSRSERRGQGISLGEKEYLNKGEFLEEKKDFLEKKKVVAYLEEENKLKRRESLSKQEHQKVGKHQQKEKHLEENTDKESRMDFLPQATSTLNLRNPAVSLSRMTTLLENLPIVQTTRKSFYENVYPLLFLQSEEQLLQFLDKTTQTEWLYKEKCISLCHITKEKGEKEGEEEEEEIKTKEVYNAVTEGSSVASLQTNKNMDSEAYIYIDPKVSEQDVNLTPSTSRRSMWEDILSSSMSLGSMESSESLEDKSQTMFKKILKEMTAEDDLEEDMDIPLTGYLESETRRKLRILLKKNVEKYKEVILWILKKREHLLGHKIAQNIMTFQLEDDSPAKKDPEHPPVQQRRKRKLEIDQEWAVHKQSLAEGSEAQ